jgi:glycerol-3-phosphate dehydrogenase
MRATHADIQVPTRERPVRAAEEVDLVVLGSGAAGLSAAVAGGARGVRGLLREG